MIHELKVDVFQNAQPLLPDTILPYRDDLKGTIDFVQLVRCVLTDSGANIQLYVADQKPKGEVNWLPLAIQSGNRMSKEALDILNTKYVAVNVVYKDGYDYGRSVLK